MRAIQRRSSLLLCAVCKVAAAVFILLPVPLPASAIPQSAAQTVNEDEVRSLTKRFGQTIAAGDLETMRQLWDPQSPNLAVRLRYYQGIFSNRGIELIRMSVTRLEVKGDNAISNLTSDDR